MTDRPLRPRPFPHPYVRSLPPGKEPKPLPTGVRDWYDAQDMTLCIGALANSNCIVFCFDSKVSSDEFGSETEHKIHVLNDRLMALVSGRPGRAKELASLYRGQLKGVPLVEHELPDLLIAPWSVVKRRIADSYTSARLGLSYDEFLTNGDAWLGKETKARYIAEIESHRIGVDMIIGGFVGDTPVLYSINEGSVEPCTNFCLIGSGAYTAEPSLHARKQRHQIT